MSESRLPTEFARIARHFRPLAGAEALGLADDAALWAPSAGCEAVLTVDQMIEDVHFLPEDDPALIARKLLRRNLSDLAAMGATPAGYLLTFAVPRGTPEEWFAGFADGLRQDQAEFRISLFGGDSASSEHAVSLTATLIGEVARGRALRRSGAKTGDGIFVTGTIGDAVLGLEAARGMLADPTGYLTARRLLPSPRIGLPLAEFAHACIDISDGLIQDLGHICRASGLGAEICAVDVPASDAARAAGDGWLETRLTGGDDYELLFAAPEAAEARLCAACGNVPLTRIGRFIAGAPEVRVLDGNGNSLTFTTNGWSHF
ncbi:MAG TPA: thiamine-phosphate kinase [Acetobacteraceae bacterium]|nr:thiamine-phosphate kinase [Acetobacteraceae bacterium]